MSGNAWNSRRKALEETFFMDRNRQLLSKLQQEMADEEQKKALSATCGISDDAVLQQLVDADIGCETLAALSLVPLVLVAWADGEIATRERLAILEASRSEGILADSVCYELLERWLDEPPEGDTLLAAWKGYVGLMQERLGDDSLIAFRDKIIGRAQKVAKAAGGILGLNQISTSEQKVLDELQAAFSS